MKTLLKQLRKLDSFLGECYNIADAKGMKIDQDKNPTMSSYWEEDEWIAGDMGDNVEKVIEFIKAKENFNTKTLNRKWRRFKKGVLRPKRKTLKGVSGSIQG